MTDHSAQLREQARQIFASGVAAAHPGLAVGRYLRLAEDGSARLDGQPFGPGPVRVVALGKAACAMAEAAAAELPQRSLLGRGIIVVDQGNAHPIPSFRVFRGGHPVPNSEGVRAARAVLDYLTPAEAGSSVLVLISGGGSALLPAPVAAITLADKIATTEILLSSGATIHEINTIRKHLSSLKGGGLARAAFPARVHALILSDVIGDDLSTIASGPTAPDPSTYGDAWAVLERFRIAHEVPEPVRRHLARGCRGEIPETPGPGDPVFAGVRNVIIGSNRQSLEAAALRAAELGYQVEILARDLAGEASAVGRNLARRLLTSEPGARPVALLAGGETTVTVRGQGRGGRNQELALSFALAATASSCTTPWVFLSAGTDGRDGPTDAAGAIVDSDTCSRGAGHGLDAAQELAENNSYEFLNAAGDLLTTGPTGTNVGDLQILLLGLPGLLVS